MALDDFYKTDHAIDRYVGTFDKLAFFQVGMTLAMQNA